MKCLYPLPPHIMLHVFETLIKPILTYGGDVWGISKNARCMIDKLYLNFARCVLGVKSTTSNHIVHGECGRIPPSVSVEIATMKYWHRLKSMNNECLVKQVYNELASLDELGFTTWVTKVHELGRILQFDIDSNLDNRNFDAHCKQHICNHFISNWRNSISDVNLCPKLRTYSLFKTSFYTEPYLYLVKEIKYRQAISRIQASSHTLAIERGRYTRPKTPVDQRLCTFCNNIEDEEHFLINCTINQPERNILFAKIQLRVEDFDMKSVSDKFLFLMTVDDSQILKWLGIFLHKSFIKRSEVIGI